MRGLAARAGAVALRAAMIRIDALWLAVEPLDMRAGADRLLARVVQVFGSAQAHHGYLFANARGTRIKLLVHDGFGVWCAARRLNPGRFVWPRAGRLGGAAAAADAGSSSTRWCWACRGSAWADERHHARVSAAQRDAALTCACCRWQRSRRLRAQCRACSICMRSPPSTCRRLPPEAAALIAAQLQQQASSSSAGAGQRASARSRWRDAKLEKLTFELARLKAWKFGAKTEAMTAEQRRAVRGDAGRGRGQPAGAAGPQLQRERCADDAARRPRRRQRKPRRQALPDHLRARGAPPRAGGHHLPDARVRPADGARRRGRQRAAGHRPGASSSCTATSTASGPASAASVLVQEPAEPQSSTAACPRQRPGGAHADQPLRRPPAVLPAGADQRALGRAHAALDAGGLGRRRRRGAGAAVRGAPALRAGLPRCCMPTRRRWRCSTRARARPRRPTSGPMRAAAFDPQPGVVYDFCLGRGAQYPVDFLGKGPRTASRRGRHAADRRVRRLRHACSMRRLPGAQVGRLRRACAGASSTS